MTTSSGSITTGTPDGTKNLRNFAPCFQKPIKVTPMKMKAANAKVTAGTGKGSVAPTGSLLQDLLGQGGDPTVGQRREQNLDALRQRHRQGSSPALEGSDAALDYLLGGDEG